MRLLEARHDVLQRLRPLGARDHLDELQRRVGARRRRTEQEAGGGSHQQAFPGIVVISLSCRFERRVRAVMTGGLPRGLARCRSRARPCPRGRRGAAPCGPTRRKSTAEFGPAACTRVTSAGTTRLSWPPPGDAELEEPQGIAEGRDVDCHRQRRRRTARSSPTRPGGKGPAQHRVVDGDHAGLLGKPPRDRERRRFVRFQPGRQRPQTAQQQPGFERRELGADIRTDRLPDLARKDRRDRQRRPRLCRNDHRCISTRNGPRDRRRARAAAERPGSPRNCR